MASKTRYDPAKAVLENLPPPTGEDVSYWEKNLELTDKGKVVASLRNLFLILSRDARWEGALGFDEFANQVVKCKPPPFDGGQLGPWGDVDDLRTSIWLSQHYRVNAEKRIVIGAVVAAANELRFHPVRQYLERLEWDRQPRLEGWLHEYLGARQSDYSRLVGLKFLIGAVARVMRPGCKMDNVLILEGPQGRWKSTALATLAGQWFGDTPFTIGDKDAYLVIRGHLIYELAELDALSRAEASRAKAFFSSTHDTFVPKYVAWATKIPRQTIFAGTVNQGTYLRDTTGNRRYWPVRIQRADIEALARDRDQLWAEAVVRFGEKTRWWVDADERELFEAEQGLRQIPDAFEDVISSWATGKNSFTMEQVLHECLQLDKSKWSHAEQTRVGHALSALGFEHYEIGRRSNPRYGYRRPEREPGEEG